MKWETPEIITKLVYASIFHDLQLNDPDLAFIDNLNSDKLIDYPIEEITKFKQHPTLMAEMITKSRTIPLDVDTIIAQHHENVYGTGFPMQLKPFNIMPIVCVFIISHDFVNKLYENDFDPDSISYICDEFRKKYAIGNFEKIINAFVEGFETLSYKVSNF